MIIFKDRISEDELFSDVYDFKLVDDIVYEVKGKYVTRRTDCSDVNIGANASAEGGEEELEEGATTSGVDVTLDNRLTETNFDKKTYLTTIKGYMKSILKKLEVDEPERCDIFKTNAAKFIKEITAKDRFKELQFFTGESMNPDGLVCLLEWREDGAVPVMMFLKDGVIGEKV